MNIVALLAGLLSGIIGSMGMGGGAVLIIYLSLFEEIKQLTAQGINLLFFIPIAISAVFVYALKREIKWKLTLKISAFGLMGTAVGWYMAGFLGGDITAKIFGGFLIILGLKEMCWLKKNNRM